MDNTLRDQRFRDLFVVGNTLQMIADQFDVSRQRVHQILFRKFGLCRSDGGAWLRETYREQYAAKVNQRCLLKWGMSKAEKQEFTRLYGRWPFVAFIEQRKNSKRRCIAFAMTFQQWWNIWQKSGHWNERGRRDGRFLYVMARYGDVGPYSVDNVRITTNGENIAEYHQLRRQKT